MEYFIKEIDDRQKIESCNKFLVNNYMWNSKQSPLTYGWMGYIRNEGLFVKMVCEETNPKATYKNPQEPVYEDSAMEVFLAFPEKGKDISNDCMYTNFEINSFGAMLANFGKGRNGRTVVSENDYKATGVKSVVEGDKWYLEVLFPETYLEKICNFDMIKEGMDFYCNFYKIAESEEIEHYGSFSLIRSEKPNFHMPVCFAKTRIIKK